MNILIWKMADGSEIKFVGDASEIFKSMFQSEVTYNYHGSEMTVPDKTVEEDK